MKSGKQRTIHIIGGSGFLGSRLGDSLSKKGYEYLICDIKKNDTVNKKVDIEDPDTFENLIPDDTIINLAALHRDDIRPLSRYDDVNVQGSVNVCEAARKHGFDRGCLVGTAMFGFKSGG